MFRTHANVTFKIKALYQHLMCACHECGGIVTWLLCHCNLQAMSHNLHLMSLQGCSQGAALTAQALSDHLHSSSTTRHHTVKVCHVVMDMIMMHAQL